VTIRDYQNDDWNSVLTIFAKAKPDELLNSCDKNDIVPLDQDEGLLRSFKSSKIFIAEQDREIVGYVGYEKSLISFLFVDPAHYKKGIGSTLLKYVLPLIGEKAWLRVAKNNIPALELYKKFHFKIAKEYSGKYNNKIPLEVYILALDPELKAWEH